MRLSLPEKLRIAADLFRMAFEIERFQIRERHPAFSEREVNHRAYALIKDQTGLSLAQEI